MSPLSDNHHRHLLHGFLAIEERLAHLEALIGETETRSPLSRRSGTFRRRNAGSFETTSHASGRR